MFRSPVPQVLNLSSDEKSEFIVLNSTFIFLDEFRMAFTPRELNIAGLVVFNTLIPQGCPGYLQLLEFPPDLHSQLVHIHVDRDRHMGTHNRDEILIADPAQAVLAMEPWRNRTSLVLLVIRMQALIERTCSIRADLRVPWDEWGRDAVSIEAQERPGCVFSTLVHGARVVVVQTQLGSQSNEVRTFNFCQRSSLPLQEGGGVTKRRALFEDGVCSNFRSGLDPDSLRVQPLSLSDGSLFYVVSCLPQYRCKRLNVMVSCFRWMRTAGTVSSWNFGNWFEDGLCRGHSERRVGMIFGFWV